jgi:uncharacterized protein (TIGR03066 family)
MRSTAVLLLVIATPLLAAPVPKAKAPTLEDKLLGKWKLVSSQGKAVPNSTFHVAYLKDGVLEFRYEAGKAKPTVYKGKYKLGEPTDENKLGTIDWTVKQGTTERGELSRITELSDDVLEFKDPEGLVERFERVKEEKQEK